MATQHPIVSPSQLPADHPVIRFQRLFARLQPKQPMPLDQVYAPDIVFEDPLHHVEGVAALRSYFDRMNAGLVQGQFYFAEPLVGLETAMLPWTMHLTLRRLRHPVTVPGCSHIRFTTHVVYQRDYFDAGALIYEHIPLLGAILRRIKAVM
jgi:hypothetical protein